MTAGTMVVLATGAWSALIVAALSLGRAARRGDALADRLLTERLAGLVGGAPRTPGAAGRPEQPRRSGREQALLAAGLGLLVAAAAGAAVASDADQWHPAGLVALLTVLAVGSDILALRRTRFRVSGSFPAVVLAMALLGPAPAVAMAVLSAVAEGLRSRDAAPLLAGNAAAGAVTALLGGLALQGLAPADGGAGLAVLVLAVFLVANALCFLLVAAQAAIARGASLRALLRSVYLPVVPWEVVAGMVTATAVLAHERWGTSVIGGFALAVGVYQLLLRWLQENRETGEKLDRQAREIGLRHERMLGLMLHTLSLRDPTAARHAAAVAHYALALARAAGLPESEQEVVHTAGLLHDIGKQGFPDSILIAEREVDPADRRLIARHPIDGARLLREVPGLEPIADAVLGHHERIDGRGYPHGLRGDEIAVSARVIAIAEAYDALTAPDSYRRPVTVGEAVAELRRCAGTQFDPELVEAFADSVASRGAAGFRRRGDADLEAELRLQRFSRELLDERSPVV